MFFGCKIKEIDSMNFKLVFWKAKYKVVKNYNFRIYKIVENDRY